MYKVGIMLMGKPNQTKKQVKEVIIEVQAKTKIADIIKYLLNLKRIQNANVDVAIEKNGRPVSESSTINQILKHTKLVNNLIKLFLYEQEETIEDMNSSAQKIALDSALKASRNQIQNNSNLQSPRNLNKGKKPQNQSPAKSPVKPPEKSPTRQPQQSQALEQMKSKGCCCC